MAKRDDRMIGAGIAGTEVPVPIVGLVDYVEVISWRSHKLDFARANG